MVSEGFGAAGFAALAPEVDALARAGDPHAGTSVSRSGQALAEVVVAAWRVICCSRRRPSPRHPHGAEGPPPRDPLAVSRRRRLLRCTAHGLVEP